MRPAVSVGEVMRDQVVAVRERARFAEIVAALDASAAGWNRGDLDAHVAAYADSATFMTGNGPIQGKDLVRDALRRSFWREGRPVQSLRFDRVEVRPLGGDYALATGHFVLSGGGQPERSGWFSLTWTRTAAGWRILHDHSS
jgi:ketosteroid isomerase-like protein